MIKCCLKNRFKTSLVVLLTFSLAACDFSDENVSREASNFIQKTKELFGFKSAPVAASPSPSASPGASAAPSTGELAKENLELLAEMMKVIFDVQEITDKSDFGSLAHSLNQGASIEGIYRGVVMGARYRGLESKSQAASPETLKAFAIEMAEIRTDMKDPTQFHEGEARKPLEIDFPDGSESAEVSPTPQGKLDLLKMFVGASPFTLKRVLCEEAMRRMDEFQNPQGKVNLADLAQWYAKLAERMAGKGVDFGLEQRNKGDFDFHYLWAQNMATDRVKWEVLNRYHRYINALSKDK